MAQFSCGKFAWNVTLNGDDIQIALSSQTPYMTTYLSVEDIDDLLYGLRKARNRIERMQLAQMKPLGNDPSKE